MSWSRGNKGEDKKKWKALTSHHCWSEIENEEKWKDRELFKIPNKRKSSVGDVTHVDDDDDA